MIVESRPPNITRASGEVRNIKLTPAIINPAPAAARVDSEMRKSFDPYKNTMLGFVSVDFDFRGQANFAIVISCSDGQARLVGKLLAPR